MMLRTDGDEDVGCGEILSSGENFCGSSYCGLTLDCFSPAQESGRNPENV